jgi:outer membrane lipopolysaccharide assembly protein LptE/RlpB
MRLGRLTDFSCRLLAITAMITGAGCGYHFAAAGSGLPDNAQTIYVQDFSNASTNTGLNNQLMRYVKEEIEEHKRLTLVDNSQGADLTLSGAIELQNTLPTTFNSVAEPTQYSEMITISAALRDNHTNKVIWQTDHMTDVDNYPVVSQAAITTSPTFLQGNLRSQDIAQMPDLQVAASEQHLTQGQMLQQIAKNLYNSMSDGF